MEVERPIREQGIYKRDVRVGHNVWIGYGACFLRGVTVGDNAIVKMAKVIGDLALVQQDGTPLPGVAPVAMQSTKCWHSTLSGSSCFT